MKKLALLIGLFSFMAFIGVASATTYTCNTCINCSDTIGTTATSGDTVQLTADLTEELDGNCISFGSASNVTFDCNGHIIEDSSDGSSSFVGIYSSSPIENIIIENCETRNWSIHMSFIQGNNITIRNINMSVGRKPTDIGIELVSSENSSIRSTNSQIYNVSFNDIAFDIKYGGYGNNLTNITATNFTTFSQGNIINSSFNNIHLSNGTIYGTQTYGIYLQTGYGNTIDGVYANNLTSWAGVIALSGSTNNTIRNIIANDSFTIIYIGTGGANYNTFRNLTTTNTSTFLAMTGTASALTIDGANISMNPASGLNLTQGNAFVFVATTFSDLLITNVNLTYNGDKSVFYIRTSSSTKGNNTITGNIINVINGKLFDFNATNSTADIFYNNIFNSSEYGNGTRTVMFNTSVRNGTNIVGGSQIGGNYWAYTNGTGYSQICDNLDNDSFCDSSFTIWDGNIDYFPLTTNWTFIFAPDIEWITPINNSFTDNLSSILWNVSVSLPSDCNLTINDTDNYSMIYSDGYCSYTTSNLTNQTTYCGYVVADSGLSNTSTIQCATINLTSFTPPEPTPPKLIDNLGMFGFIGAFAIGAGILMFLLDAFFGSFTEMLRDPKKLVTIVIGAIIMVAVFSVLF